MNPNTIPILAFCILISFSLATAQTAPEIQWQNTIGGYSSDYMYSVIQTTDGGYLLGGYSLSGISGDKIEPSQGEYDYWVVKLDEWGNIVWQNAIGGNHDDVLHSVIQTSDGGYLLGGYSRSTISGDKTEDTEGDLGYWAYDYWVVRLDSSGNILWQNTIGGSGDDYLNSVIQTPDGGYLLGGYSYSEISGDKTEESDTHSDYWVVKLDSSGNILWQNTIGGYLNDNLLSVIQTTDGGYLLGGWSESDISGDKSEFSEGGSDYWVVKLDGSGNILWQNTIGGYGNDYLNCVIQTTDGGYMLGGYSYSDISGDKTEASQDYDYWVVKLDELGNIIWENTIGSNDEDYLRSVIQTQDGGYLLGGSSWSGISDDKTEACQGYSDYWVVKLNEEGYILWQNTLGGNYQDELYSVINTIDGGYMLGGYSQSGISEDKTEYSQAYDYWVIKLSAEGTVVCQHPTSLSADNITPTSVNLKWDAVPGAIGYRVRYKPAGTSQWTLISSTNNEITILGLTPNTEYGWKVRAVCSQSSEIYSDSSAESKFTTAPMRLGAGYESVFEVYPNPISQSATVSFSLNEESSVVIQIMDVNGRSLKIIAQNNFSQGSHEITFNRESLPAGIYFLQLKTNEGVMIKKLMIE